MSNAGMKISVMLVLLAACVAFAGCAALPAAEQTHNNAQPAIVTGEGIKLIDLSGKEIVANKLTVSATGSKKVMPDVGYLTVGLKTQNKSMKKAQSANRETMNALFDTLKGTGLAQDDIRTVNYSVYPMYDYTSGSGKISGYEVTNMIELTIRDIDTVGDYIDIAAANGANTDYSVRFDILDKSVLYNEALELAVENAKGKADAIASAGGYKIISTLEISESQSYYSPPYDRYEMAEADGAASTPITAGQLEITANVTVVYQIQ